MIIIKTSRPYSLVRRIKELIDEGEIQTWSYDEDGDFTHDVQQWRYKAWLRPVIYKGECVKFKILCTRQRPVNRMEYSVYHGRFIEMLINHVPNYCSSIEATPEPSDIDHITPRIR